MTIATTSNKAIWQGNGSTTVFPFVFEVGNVSEITLYLTSGGSVTTIPSSSYSVSGLGSPSGGTITYPLSGSPIPTGTSLTLIRTVPLQQLTDLVNQSNYFPDAVEGALDYEMMAIQQIAQQVSYSLQTPESDPTLDLTLPNASARADTLVGFDINGNVITYPVTASVGAGNMTDNIFLANTNFTPGVTATLPLQAAYGSTANVFAYFDGVPQFGFTINGTSITFPQPIPVGVQQVLVKGGTTLSTGVPANGTVGPTQLQANCIGLGQIAWSNILQLNVDTIAALRLVSSTLVSRVFVNGYYAAGDGGGGEYLFVPTDTSSNDNGGSIIVGSDGGRWHLNYQNDTISIKQFGAKVDGATDDSVAIQACINFFESVNGGVIYFPRGTTLINAGITVHYGGIVLAGSGWQEYAGVEANSGGPGTLSSYILTTTAVNSTITFANTVEHAVIRDIAFRQTQPADAPGWTPTIYPPTINCIGASTSSGAVLMERLFCWNCYEFIRLGSVGNFTGRATMKHIWGMPIMYGMNMIASSDTALVDDVHFWPFEENIPNIQAWIQANGYGMQIIRSDNFILTNIFIYGRGIGILMGSSSDGSTQNWQMSNIGFDSTNVGILFNEVQGACDGHISTMYHQGSAVGSGQGGWAGISINSVNNLNLDIVNFKSTFAGGSCVFLSGSADVSIVNAWIDDWNQSATGAAAFNVGAGCTLTLGGRLRATGSGTVQTGSGTYNAGHVN